jgi:type IV secretory pathway TraG/TraD family ATPase VirD4
MNPRFNKEISYFAETNFRGSGNIFGMWQADRLLHTYIIGKTGTGKSNLLSTLILQDVIHGRGLALFDVHGDLLARILQCIPEHRKQDIIYLDLTNPQSPFRYNPLKRVSAEKRSLVASGILETFQKLWRGAWGVKLEHILRYIILTLLDQPKAFMNDIIRIIHDQRYQEECIKNVQSQEVKSFWEDEFPKYTKNDVIPVLNKIGAFLVHPASRRFLIDNPVDVSLRQAMDNSKIVLINLSKGSIGVDVAHLIGSIVLNAFSYAAFSRTDTPEEERVPFHIFLDEFHNYTNPSLINMLSELRKYKVSLTLAHQYMNQLDPDIRNAVLGNVGTIISFRLGQQDARYLEHECYPIFTTDDFTNLENFEIYLKLMILGKPSKAFSAKTLPFNWIHNLSK